MLIRKRILINCDSQVEEKYLFNGRFKTNYLIFHHSEVAFTPNTIFHLFLTFTYIACDSPDIGSRSTRLY